MTPARPAPPRGEQAVREITLWVPGTLENPSNERWWGWQGRSEWAHRWRSKTRAAWLIAGQPTREGRCHFTFKGIVRRLFDDDNFPGCVKPVRDEITKILCGTDDSPVSGHRFTYEQETLRKGERGVVITIKPVTPSGRDGQASKEGQA